jgi:hypothetical protein
MRVWAPVHGVPGPTATVFGNQGLCIAEPRVTVDHRPVYVLSRFLLDPWSLRSTSVDHGPDAADSVVRPARASAPRPLALSFHPGVGLGRRA